MQALDIDMAVVTCPRTNGGDAALHRLRETLLLLLQVASVMSDIDSSPPGSPVNGILQARTLAWVAISFSNA